MPELDATLLDGVLRAAVKDRTVDYDAVAARRKELDAWLARAAAAAPLSWSEDERLAFFTNAYNAIVLGAFLDGGRKSVLEVRGFFDRARFKVGGEELTLNELEEKKLRRLDARGRSCDPRIHFVVNCASRDCPPLAPRAYRGSSFSRDLEERTRAFLHRPGEIAVDEVGRRIVVVQLFEWYASDFGGEEGVRAFLAQFRPDLKSRIVDAAGWDLDFRPYDWRPNAVGAR